MEIFRDYKLRRELDRALPGGESSTLHRHSKQERFISILSVKPTLVTGQGEIQLKPGMCAGFPTNGAAHHLIHRSPATQHTSKLETEASVIMSPIPTTISKQTSDLTVAGRSLTKMDAPIGEIETQRSGRADTASGIGSHRLEPEDDSIYNSDGGLAACQRRMSCRIPKSPR